MTVQQSTPSRRIATSDDLEVSAYLEIAKEKEGQGSQRLRRRPKYRRRGHHRLRLPVQPPDCAPHTRVERVQRGRPAHFRLGRRGGDESQGGYPFPAGRPASTTTVRHLRPRGCSRKGCRYWVSATGCRCWPTSWAGRWPRAPSGNTAMPFCTRTWQIRRCFRVWTHHARLDEPRRPDSESTSWVFRRSRIRTTLLLR